MHGLDPILCVAKPWPWVPNERGRRSAPQNSCRREEARARRLRTVSDAPEMHPKCTRDGTSIHQVKADGQTLVLGPDSSSHPFVSTAGWSPCRCGPRSASFRLQHNGRVSDANRSKLANADSRAANSSPFKIIRIRSRGVGLPTRALRRWEVGPRSRQSRWCWSRVDSEELERSDDVTSGLAECCGDVGFPGQAQGADGEVSE